MVEPKHKIKVFVIMPFGNNKEYAYANKESNFVYERIIKPSVESTFDTERIEIKINREVDRNAPGSISSEIIRSIALADIVIADMTGRNPNVFLELGIRFSLKDKITILIAQYGTIPPFDVADYRTIFYTPVEPELAQKQIADAIKEGFSPACPSDSLVFDTFPDISVVIPGYCESYGYRQLSNRNAMPWPAYWKRIEEIGSLLEGPSSNGQFTPDVIVGISNGGLVVADLIGRTLFRGKPILSLWANRFSKSREADDSFWFFDNEYNNALMGTIKTNVEKRSALILLLDDHLGTGSTVIQAVNYIKAKLENNVEILFIPMFSNRPEYIEVVEEYLPYRFSEGRVFPTLTKETFLETVKTKADLFPYLKEISRGA